MIYFLSLPASIINMLLLTIERLLILLFPLTYRKYITKPKVIVLLIITWLYVTVVAVYPFVRNPRAVVTDNQRCFIDFSMSYGFYQIIVDFAIPLACVFVLNVCIFKLSQRKASLRKDLLHQKCLAVNMKAAKTILVILLNVSACWMTYIVIIGVNLSSCCYSLSLTFVGKAVNSTSAATNPMLYGLLNTSIRKIIVKRFQRFYACLFKRRAAENENNAFTLLQRKNGSISQHKSKCSKL